MPQGQILVSEGHDANAEAPLSETLTVAKVGRQPEVERKTQQGPTVKGVEVHDEVSGSCVVSLGLGKREKAENGDYDSEVDEERDSASREGSERHASQVLRAIAGKWNEAAGTGTFHAHKWFL